MWQRSQLYVRSIMFLAPALLVGCSESGIGSRATQSSVVAPDNGTDSPTLGIDGQTFTSSFAAAGRVELTAGVTATGATAMRLFEEDPSETPQSGWMTLSSSSVTVVSKATGKVTPQSQALPLSGTATVRVSIMPGSSTDLCDQAEFMAEYEVILTTGVATVVEERYELGAPALLVIAQNEVTMCIAVTADFDGELILADFDLTFGGEARVPTFILHNLDNESIGLLMPAEVFNPSTLIAAGDTRTQALDGARLGDSIIVRAGDNVVGMVASTTCPTIEGPNYVAVVEWDVRQSRALPNRI